ncbi:MAG: hypothetical protein HFH67_13110 [Lachnospiraceae bacterium]|nr:hypothetical protein [Lachnospiraceae bacterium]
MKVSGITTKAGKKKVTGKLSVKGTKVTIKVTKSGYKAVTKTVKVK